MRYLFFSGLGLVFVGVGLRFLSVEYYYIFLIPGIALKVIYLIIGLLNGRLAGGRYLLMLFAGIAMVGAGSYLKNIFSEAPFTYWILWFGFLLKAVSIVFMVVVGRKRRMIVKPKRVENVNGQHSVKLLQ